LWLGCWGGMIDFGGKIPAISKSNARFIESVVEAGKILDRGVRSMF